LDDLDELVCAVAVAAGVVDQFSGLLDDGAAFGCAGDGDAAPAAELEGVSTCFEAVPILPHGKPAFPDGG
jgi:hypothetical protein